jgi:hypothetical protein
MAMISPSVVWLAGVEWRVDPEPTQPLLLRWDGRRFVRTRFRLPGAEVFGVSGTSASDVWAVANIADDTKSVILHWDGSRWRRVAGPRGLQRANTALSDVVAISPHEVWAVGEYNDIAFESRPLLERWDGRRWRTVSLPWHRPGGGVLTAISASSSSDIWVVGWSEPSRPLLPFKPVAFHWNGARWTSSKLPRMTLVGGRLGDVAVLSSHSAWAVGSTDNNESDRNLYRTKPYNIRFTQNRWKAVTRGERGTPGVGFQGLSAATPNRAWAWSTKLLAHWDRDRWRAGPQVPWRKRGDAWIDDVAADRTHLWVVGSHNDASQENRNVLGDYSCR